MEYFKGLSRKEYILKTAEMIKRDGIENLSIRKIAKELGCSSASLYRYFSGLDELIYYAELRQLKDYIQSLNKAGLVWKNVWDKYVGVWYCYSMEAFRKPITYNLLFLTKKDIKLKEAIESFNSLESIIVEKKSKDTVKEVGDRIAKANLPKPKIYIEFGRGGPEDIGITYGKDMWGSLIDLAGGDNIAADLVEQWSPINAEQVIAAKPDVIMITGRETELKKEPTAMVMGINIDKAEALKRLDGFKKRVGWSELPAIKNNRLYGLYMGASRTLADMAMVQYIAKALYPQLFKDLDPIKTYVDFHKKYLPVVPVGTIAIQADEK